MFVQARLRPILVTAADLLLELLLQLLVLRLVDILVAGIHFQDRVPIHRQTLLRDSDQIVVVRLHLTWLVVFDAPVLICLIQLKILVDIVRHMVADALALPVQNLTFAQRCHLWLGLIRNRGLH